MSQVKYLRLCWGTYRPLEVSTFIPTGKHIAEKKAVVNIRSLDDYCFQYSVLAGMNLVSVNTHQYCHKERAYIYKPFMLMLNMDGIQSPVPLSSIGKFESKNPDISVSVLYHEGDQIYPFARPNLQISANIMLHFSRLQMVMKNFITKYV